MFAIIKQLISSFYSSNLLNFTSQKTAILKKYPEVFKEIVECIPECIEFTSEPESKCALLWILGEFGSQIPNAPYLF